MKKLLGMTTNYHAKNFLTENVLAIDMKKTQMPIKPKYGEKTKYVIWIQTKQ